MVKKFHIGVLISLIMLSSGSFMVKVHYCQDKLRGVGLVLPSMEGCKAAYTSPCCAQKKAAEDCCTDEIAFTDGDLDHALAINYATVDSPDTGITFVHQAHITPEDQIPTLLRLRPPPETTLPSGTTLRIWYQSFSC
ncbi:MAG: hypothetical protein AAFR14_01550 [Bacteroidota bacterium]